MAVVSLDIRKAFDSVWHKGLIHKLSRTGCDNHSVAMIKSFLKDRKAKIKINNQYSKEVRIERGVPQGTRLGPILYNIYTGEVKITEA